MLDGHAPGARELSRSFLHWMQTEGGFPGLRLRGDVVGDTPDGLAKHAYIREPRRLQALRTVREQDIAGPGGARRFDDSVGIGSTGSTCTLDRRRPLPRHRLASRSRSRSGR